MINMGEQKVRMLHLMADLDDCKTLLKVKYDKFSVEDIVSISAKILELKQVLSKQLMER